jgi:hypothetical protein
LRTTLRPHVAVQGLVKNLEAGRGVCRLRLVLAYAISCAMS